jgi:two-component system sensor histidine kinase SenX3
MTTVVLVVLALAIGFYVGRRRERAEESVTIDAQASVSATSSDEGEVVPQVQAALDSLSVGVVVAAADGTVVFRNVMARGLTGAVHSDVLVDEAVDVHLRGALGGDSRRQVLDLFGPPRKVVAVSATPLSTGGAVAMVEDITERSLVDAVRTDFVANISHELKTPVGALAVLAEALSAEDDLDVIHRLSGKMVDEALRVGRTIDDLLELSRIELGGEAVKEAVSVALVIAEAVDRARPLSERRAIDVSFVEASDRMKVLGDRRQLVSALGNLVENAVKYSERGSKVEVSARSDGQWVEFKVRDYGLGIPARDIDRIFERFYRVDRARSRETGGTGLGLAIVRHVANNHGGEVSVTSIEGEGSTFLLRVPAAPGLVMTSMSEAG